MQLDLQLFLLMVLWSFKICFLMKFKLYHFSTRMVLGLQIITPGNKMQGLSVGLCSFWLFYSLE